MQEARDLVNSWLHALNPDGNARLDDENTIDLALENQRALALYLDEAAGKLHWALPIKIGDDSAGLSNAQLTDLAALNYAQQATRGARLALVANPDRVQLLYGHALNRLDQNRFITITGELVATAATLATQLTAPPDSNRTFHASV